MVMQDSLELLLLMMYLSLVLYQLVIIISTTPLVRLQQESSPATNLHVGTAGTIITTQVGFGSVGIGSANPTADFDVNVHARFRSMSERVGATSSLPMR